MENIQVDVVAMYPDVIIPKYQTTGSAGCDVHAYLKDIQNPNASSVHIQHGMRGVMIPTGLKIAIPRGFYMAVVPRSGMAVKTTMRIANQPGTVDSDFRNEVKIIVDNIGESEKDDLHISHQDRIAQFIFLPYYQAIFNVIDSLDKTDRSGGFGSTGIK